ncbi:MAG: hypothetical protein M1819_000713 [Sarea resinae]|nr:MAG: hypothetical protein M1819_000713 [Sarea resinae]
MEAGNRSGFFTTDKFEAVMKEACQQVITEREQKQQEKTENLQDEAETEQSEESRIEKSPAELDQDEPVKDDGAGTSRSISELSPSEGIPRANGDSEGQSGQQNPYAGLSSAKKRKGADRSPSAEASTFSDRPVKRPFAPAKKGTKAPLTKLQWNTSQSVDSRVTTKGAEWYQKVDAKAKFNRGDLISVQGLNTLVKNCQKEKQNGGDCNRLFSETRTKIHKMEFFDFISPIIVKKSKVLDENQGFELILSDDVVDFPWDIKADALALYSKWLSGVFDPHLLRGIVTETKYGSKDKQGLGSATATKRTGHKLDKNYEARVSCNVVGANGLVNGQWWPMQICAMRDGAHGEIEAGICGQQGKGAFSIILSSGGYADEDEGEVIFYCGTSGSEGKPSAGTGHLLETHRRANPVRVLRTSNLPPKDLYRPQKGIRYDGLYNIVGFEVLDQSTAMHRFELHRLPDQDPIRYKGVEKRPTDEEVVQYMSIRGKLGLTS